jgi:glycosyltransferase involved in cell wall biosynthesis
MSATSEPLVSVITPAYNAESYLDVAIESVIAQTYSAWELIIVDDGSTDGTAALVKSWAAKDPRIVYLYQKNQRMASARNTGLKHAQGKYIAFLDADNLFLSDKLKTQVTYLESHPDVGVVYSRIIHFYDREPGVFYENKNEKPLAEDQFRDLLYRNAVNVLSVLIRKECFDRYGAFQEQWKACDEHFVWINLAAHDVRFAFLPETVGRLRLHPNEYSRRPEFIYDTAFYFLKLIPIIEQSLSAEKRARYQADFGILRRRWERKLLAGKFLKNPLTSWFLMPLYQRHFDDNFTKLP